MRKEDIKTTNMVEPSWLHIAIMWLLFISAPLYVMAFWKLWTLGVNTFISGVSTVREAKYILLCCIGLNLSICRIALHYCKKHT